MFLCLKRVQDPEQKKKNQNPETTEPSPSEEYDYVEFYQLVLQLAMNYRLFVCFQHNVSSQ